MDKKKEEMFDAMIKIAGREVLRQDLEAMPSEGDIDVTFTPGFERKMKTLIKRRRRKARSLPAKILRFAVVCIAILSLTFTSAFAFVPPFRERAVKTVIEWTGISAGFTFAESDGIRPGYIPDGFVEVDFWEAYNSIYITYANHLASEIYFSKAMINGLKISIDSEHSTYHIDVINGLEAHIFTSNAEGYPSYVLFNDDTHAYLVYGFISVEELIRIAESIPIEK
jgi:hypothetical protein